MKLDVYSSRDMILWGLVALAWPSRVAAADPSGMDMPTADFYPWKRIFSDNFLVNAPRGTFADKDKYGTTWHSRGWDWDADPRNASVAPTVDSMHRGIYSSARTLEVSNGLLDIWPHKAQGPQFGANGKLEGGEWKEVVGKPWQAERPYVAAITPYVLGNGKSAMRFGRYTVRFKVEYPKTASGQNNYTAAKGYKTAWLLWPRSEAWPRDGEIDYPEGDLSTNYFSAFHHWTCNNSTSGPNPEECKTFKEGTGVQYQEGFERIASYSDWHTATIEWKNGRINFLLDGQLARSHYAHPRDATTTKRVPGTVPHPDPNVKAEELLMRWILQTETELNDEYIPATSEAHIKVDWVVVWKYEPCPGPECPK